MKTKTKVIVGEPSIIDEVTAMDNNVKKIEKSLYDVVRMKMRGPAKKGFKSPEHAYGIYKSDGGRCLGVVGKNTVPTQPKFLLNVLLNTVMSNGMVFDLSKLTFTERQDGSRIEFTIPLPSIEVPSKLKKGDIIEQWLVFSTSYNGNQANKVQMMTKACWCDNQMVRNFTASSLSIRNTKNSETKIERFFYDLGEILKEVDKFKVEMFEMCKTKVNNTDIERAICRTFHVPELKDDRSQAATNRFERMMKSMDLEIDRRGKTVFGLLQGLTHYVNHNDSFTRDNPDYISTGYGFKVNNRAQKEARSLISAN